MAQADCKLAACCIAAYNWSFKHSEFTDAGLLHPDIHCLHGGNLCAQAQEPRLEVLKLRWQDAPLASLDSNVLRPASEPFDSEGGLRRLAGNLGRAIVKISAVTAEHRSITAPARIFESQDDLLDGFKAGSLTGDFAAVVRAQGPRANVMPELHKLTPTLAVMQDRGQRVALLTDGRMSGASGKVPAAIHVVPEAITGGLLARLHDGDTISIDADAGKRDVLVDETVLAARTHASFDL